MNQPCMSSGNFSKLEHCNYRMYPRTGKGGLLLPMSTAPSLCSHDQAQHSAYLYCNLFCTAMTAVQGRYIAVSSIHVSIPGLQLSFAESLITQQLIQIYRVLKRKGC